MKKVVQKRRFMEFTVLSGKVINLSCRERFYCNLVRFINLEYEFQSIAITITVSLYHLEKM